MSSATAIRFETLSNELLLEVFEYLDAYNLCQAFHGLNRRINALLRSVQLHILYNSSNENKTVWDVLKSFVNPSQIRILSSYDGINIDEQFLSSVYENLRSVRLNGINKDKVKEIVQHFPNNNQIKCFYLKEINSLFCNNSHPNVNFLLDLVDGSGRFISLLNLSLSFASYRIDNDFPTVSVTFPHLRHLSIRYCYWTTNLLRFLQDNTPNLRSFQLIGFIYNLNYSSRFDLKHIHELHITYPGDLGTLKYVLSTFPCLRRLHVGFSDNRLSQAINGTQWQELIEKCIPHLKQLTIDFNEGMDEQILETFYTGDFWSIKNVNVKMMVKKAESRYRLVKTIYFGKQWSFEYHNNFYL